METFWLIVSILLVLVGFLGSFLPVLPGIPLIFFGYLVWGVASQWADFSTQALLVVGLVTGGAWLADFYAGAAGASRYGASRYGIAGSIAGAIIGAIFFNLPGLIVGPFAGAVLMEIFSGKPRREALRAGWGAVLGMLAGGLLKIV
ncbi:MAG TPA: DUF456 domain-containing protein, partial [Calditrichia bacterium]|nr:DUF456 domain-containing protein [Calditrichia bacterium]